MNQQKSVSVLIVDDEMYSRQYLRELLERDGRFSISAECEGGQEAIAQCAKSPPDVMFLDIEMPRINGFDVLDALADPHPIVVIVSAFSKYAVHAFDCEVFDYVTKPIDPARFSKSIDRVYRRHLEKQAICATNSSTDLTNSEDDDQEPRKILNTIRGQLFYREKEIQFLESAGNYVKVVLEKESHLVRDTLMHLFNTLDNPGFVRVHRSYVVNLRHVRSFSLKGTGQAELLMEDGGMVPVSRNRRKQVADLLRNYVSLQNRD